MKNEGAKKIRIMLMERDLTQAKVARLLGVTLQAVNNTLSGNYKSRRVVEALALYLNSTPEEIAAIIRGEAVDAGKAA